MLRQERRDRSHSAQELVNFLNGTEEVHRIARRNLAELIDLFQAGSSEDIMPFPRAAHLRNAGTFVHLGWATHPKMAKLRQRLSNYRFCPFLAMPPQVTRTGRWHIAMIPAHILGEPKRPGAPNPDEAMGAWEIIKLAEADLIGRLRHCQQCGQWYLATRQKQSWCSFRCRQKHYLSKPKVRKQRNAYMRDYMREHYSVKAARGR